MIKYYFLKSVTNDENFDRKILTGMQLCFAAASHGTKRREVHKKWK